MRSCIRSIVDCGLRTADSTRNNDLRKTAIRHPQWPRGVVTGGIAKGWALDDGSTSRHQARSGAVTCGEGDRRRTGFSLGEMLAVVIIGSMILVAVLTIYSRANQAAESVLRKIDSPAWASEVLQLIAEDLDRIVQAEDVTVQIRNGFDNKFQRAELVLRRTYHDNENKEQVLEEITWRAGYDHEGQTPGLVLYRSYEGLAREDKLLDDNREDAEKFSPFVPVCRGVTYFRIQACKGADLIDQWPLSAPPPGIRITLSFGEPHETVSGGFDVADAAKISRTVAIDPLREVKFALARGADANGVADANAPAGAAENSQPSPDQASGRQPPRGSAANERTTDARTPKPTRSR